MQDGSSNIKILGLNTDGKTISNNRVSGNVLNPTKPIVIGGQQSFQDDKMSDVSNKMEFSVKQTQANYFNSALYPTPTTKKPFDFSEIDKRIATKTAMQLGMSTTPFSGFIGTDAVEQITDLVARSKSNFDKGKFGAGVADVINAVIQTTATPFTVPLEGITKVIGSTGEVGEDINRRINNVLQFPFEATKMAREELGIDLGESGNELLDTVTGIAVTSGILHGAKDTIKPKGSKGSKTSTDVQGETFSESSTQSTNPKLLDQPKRFTSSEVGDTKIVPTPQEQLAISKAKVGFTELNNKALELNNKAEVLTEQLKGKKTKANKEAVKKVNEELEDVNARRDAIQAELDFYANDLQQRSLKGALEQDRGTFGSGVAPVGEGKNAPSAIDFTGAKDPSGRLGGTETTTTRSGKQVTTSTEGIAPDRLQPVKTSVHDYLVERGLEMFKLVKANKPLDPTVLGDILRQARDKGVYDEVLNTLREEAFKRGKTLDFETALKNTVEKVDAEIVKPSELGEGVKPTTPQAIVESEGLVYNGIQKTKRGDYVTWTDPKTGSTHLLPAEGLTKEALLKQRDEYRAKETPSKDIVDAENKYQRIRNSVRQEGKKSKQPVTLRPNVIDLETASTKVEFDVFKKKLLEEHYEYLADARDILYTMEQEARGITTKEKTAQEIRTAEKFREYFGKDVKVEFVRADYGTVERVLSDIQSLEKNIKALESATFENKTGLSDRYLTGETPSSRIISEELNKKADDILRDNLNVAGSNPLFNPKLYGALVIKGAYHFENGVVRFSQWSKKMIEENGEKIRPALNSIWNEIQKNTALKQTAITNSLSNTEKVNKLNTAVVLESKPPDATPFEHTLKTKAESFALNTLGKYVEKQGEAGKTLVDAGNKVFRESSQFASKYIKLYHDSIIGLSKTPKLMEEFIKIANEGGKSTNPLVNKALDAWNTIRTEIAQKSTEQEMTMSYFDAKSKTFKEKPFAPIENFFPHKFDFNKLRSDKFRKQFVDNLASKLDVSRPEAERIWNQYIRKNTINEFKNIERVRQFDIDGWRQELEVIPEYIQGASRRLKEVEIFGKEYQKANEWIAEIDRTGKDFSSAQMLFDKWVGRDRYDRDFARYVPKLNSWQVLNKLGLLNLLNWTQVGNAGILFGTRSFAKQMLKQVRDYPEMRRMVEPSGALDNSLAAYQLDSMSSSGIGDFMLRKTGVVAQERWNRVFSASVGMDYMTRQLNSLIKNPNNKKLRNEMQRKIDMLNLTKEVNIDNALKRGKFTEKELLDVGYEGARKTQFLSRPQDLPNFMSNKDLKFFTLFKSFVMQQSTLVKDAVIKETFKGNLRPLLFMATVFPALGEIANTARAIVSGDKKGMEESLLLHKQEWSKIIERYAIDLATIGSFGFAYDVAKASTYSPDGLAAWTLGANFSDLGSLAYALGMATPMGGWNFKPLAKFSARQVPIPIVKQQIGNMLKEEFGSGNNNSGVSIRGGR